MRHFLASRARDWLNIPVNQLFRTIDEHYHRSQRTRGSLIGFWVGLLFVAGFSVLGWLPIPGTPMLVTLGVFGVMGTVAYFTFHKYGFDSAIYRVANWLEPVTLLVGLAVAMVLAPESGVILSAFYLVNTVMQAPGTGASPMSIFGAVAPAGLAALYQAQFRSGEDWHITASTALLAGFLGYFIGSARDEQVKQAAHYRRTERELALANAALENERRLREIEQDWIATLTHSASALYLLDPAGGLRPVSDEAGYHLDTLADGPEFSAVIRDAARLAAATREAQALFGIALPGGSRWVDLRIVPLPGSERLAVLVQDVSERIALEAKHKELTDRMALTDKMVSMGILSAGVAHEINNPLTYISGNIEYVLASKLLDANLARRSSTCRKAFSRSNASSATSRHFRTRG